MSLQSGNSLFLLPNVVSMTLGDKVSLQRPCPFEVVAWGFYVTTVALDATPLALLAALDRDTIGGGREDAVGGKTLNADVDQARGSTLIVRPTAPLNFGVGQSAIVQVTQAPTGGDGFAFIQYRPRGLHEDIDDKVIDVSL